eukprot:TRINITY_DN15367_c0_g1_i1.p1 TRINITY_DN15367_c0_g1~~TRINITY_DN15367_c0_g1_i1.p1  ORF type:complete len:179 (-),score=37.24 TRINITY_DN15367_c0_g1_i1:222-758(-)
MIRSTYVSRSYREFTQSEKEDLLAAAQRKNAFLNITGILFLSPQVNMQTLEGNQPDVDALMDSIKRDSRHHDVTVIMRHRVRSRLYTNWRMKPIELSSQQRLVMESLMDGILQGRKVDAPLPARRFDRGTMRFNAIRYDLPDGPGGSGKSAGGDSIIEDSNKPTIAFPEPPSRSPAQH